MNVHSRARTNPYSRALIVKRDAWSEDQASALGVSLRTGFKWKARYREEGPAGLLDRSSRPHRMPGKTASEAEELIVLLRRCGLTAAEISRKLGLARSTVSAVLKRAGLSRLSDLEPIREVTRYERERPGELIHMDVKKLGRIRGIGHRITGDRRSRARGVGWEFVHVAIDDASRLAYVEVLANERSDTTVGFLRRALIFFRRHGIRVERVMTDNGSNYVSHLFAQHCAEHFLRHLRTRPYRPCTNGKAERFIQTLIRLWAYKRGYRSSKERTAALPAWLRYYNHRRPHAGLNGDTPASRVVTQC
jgi:transposase InsO family protein